MYDYSKIDKKVSQIVNKVYIYSKKYLTKKEIHEAIFKAYEFAKNSHEGQMRLSGDPYIIHPVEATIILLELKPDISTIQACLLHDVIEDTPVTVEKMKELFWEEVAFLCAWMEKLSKIRYQWEDRDVWSLRKMFVAMAEDLRVIFIKLSDRLHNMKTLKYHPKKAKQEKIALETLNIYAPIADRLGLFNIKNALEEECFKILEPESYKAVKKELSHMKEETDYFVKNAKKEIEKSLIEWWVSGYEVDYRVKSEYSIYKKMKRKGYDSINSLYDLFWLRVIVKDIETCYKVLWIIHHAWYPMPNRFKDYIALPKPNGYKSLHTTVVGLLPNHRKQPTEIQIKTYDMKEYSDIWVAAHFEYKENGSRKALDIDWVKELKEITESLENQDFMTSIKIDVFKDRIFVFSPKWDSINLPQWSTPVDYAYAIHSDLWNHLAVAKVSGKVYPLDKELKNGDIVEIIIDKNRKPSPFWISFVKTTKAKDHIKYFLKKESKDVNRERGRDILNKYLQNIGLPNLDKEMILLKSFDGKEYSVEERWQLLEQIWNFSTTPSSLLRRIIKDKKIETSIKKELTKNKKDLKEDIKQKKELFSNIIIGEEEGLPYRFCSCTKKKKTSKIVAHINNKWIITIHNRDCRVLITVNKERLLPAYIKGEESNAIIAHIDFTLKNKIWVLKELSDIIFSMNINVEEIKSHKIGVDKTGLSLVLEIMDHDYLIVERFIERVKINLWNNLLDFKVSKIDA